jgi:hypothetical protein
MINFKSGQYVRHFKYGCGTILERNDNMTTVDFDTAGVRKFVTAMASFEIAEGEAPKKKRATTRRKVKTAAAAV